LLLGSRPRAGRGAAGRDRRVARRAGQTLDLTLESERTRTLDRRSIAIDPIEVRRGLPNKLLCAAQKKYRI
jgi:hypothetical protein